MSAYIFLVATTGQQPILVVVHPKDSASKRAAQYMSYGFREAVGKSDKFVLASQAALYGDREVDTKKLERDAEALAHAAQTDYDNLETDKAQQKFEQALGIYENNAGEIDSMKPAAKYALFAAAAAMLNSNEKLARTYMQRALLYDPNAQADPRIYNSAAMSMFKDVRAKMSRGQKGSLSVSSNPAYAELYVDGEFLGMTPDKIDRLDAGPHTVRAVRDGFRSTSEVIDVRTRGETMATLNMVAMPQQQQVTGMLDKATADLRAPINPAAAAVAAKGGAGYVLVCSVSVNGDQVKAQVALYQQSNAKLAYAERTFSAAAGDTYAEEARALWDAMQRDISKLVIGRGTGLDVNTKQVATSKSKLKWIVTGSLLGAGGAMLITGGIFGGLALAQQESFHQLVQTDPTVPDVQRSLRTKALIADVTLIGGAVVAAAGVLCLFLWDDRPKTTKLVENNEVLDSLKLDVSVSPGGAYVGAYGRF